MTLSATTTALVAGTKYHVIWQSDGTTYTCWINGVSQTIVTWNTIPSAQNGVWFGDVTGTSPVMTIGVQYLNGAIGSGAWFDGKIDELAYISGQTLSAGQVATIYNSGTPTNPNKWPVLPATWLRMGDSRDSATTVFDEIGSNDFTLVNMNASNYVAA